MSDTFFRFPHTPHLAWLGTGLPRDDKLLSRHEVDSLLRGEVVVEEKIDGANLGLSLGPDGLMRAQNRGDYLELPYRGQFTRLGAWLGEHGHLFQEFLEPQLIVFGEWCAARHSLDYGTLPDWYIVFDVYDRHEQAFWNTVRRNALAGQLGLRVVPELARGPFDLARLKELLRSTQSHYRKGPPEGIVVRREDGDWCPERAKLVQADFTQSIEEHWRRRSIEWNSLA